VFTGAGPLVSSRSLSSTVVLVVSPTEVLVVLPTVVLVVDVSTRLTLVVELSSTLVLVTLPALLVGVVPSTLVPVDAVPDVATLDEAAVDATLESVDATLESAAVPCDPDDVMSPAWSPAAHATLTRSSPTAAAVATPRTFLNTGNLLVDSFPVSWMAGHGRLSPTSRRPQGPRFCQSSRRIP
jgi:hypothetical protein